MWINAWLKTFSKYEYEYEYECCGATCTLRPWQGSSVDSGGVYSRLPLLSLSLSLSCTESFVFGRSWIFCNVTRKWMKISVMSDLCTRLTVGARLDLDSKLGGTSWNRSKISMKMPATRPYRCPLLFAAFTVFDETVHRQTSNPDSWKVSWIVLRAL